MGRKERVRYSAEKVKQTGKSLRIKMYKSLPLYSNAKTEDNERHYLESYMYICSHKAKATYYSSLDLFVVLEHIKSCNHSLSKRNF